MKKLSNTPRSHWLSVIRNTVGVMAMIGFGTGAAWAAPLAGTTIGNQAAATYTDASAITRTATSNTVVTTVSQVAALTLATPQTVVGAPGQPVSLPHTVTNTGNGNDTYALSSATVTAGTAGLSAVTFFPDTNCDGVADSGSPAITSVGPVAAGVSACFIAQTTVSPTGTNVTPSTFNVVATSGFTPATSATNLDSVTVSNQAVIGVTKSASVAAAVGPATGVDITYTLSFTNTGNATATDVILADVVPTGATYVAASAKWNGVVVADGAVAAAAPTAGTITYDFGLTNALTVTARIGSVTSNSSGTLSFTVNVPAGTTPGTINNTAQFCYNNGAVLVPAGHTPATCPTVGPPTNKVPYIVGATYSVIASDYFQSPNLQGAAAATPTDSSTTDLGGVKNDVVTVAAATQGATVTFDNVTVNGGNATDTLNIATSGSTFPSGTTFLYFKAGGLTPLTDTNGDGIVDTGALAPSAVYHVFVQAILPSGVVAAGPFNVTVTATSVGDATKFDAVTDSLTTITANTVDLTNNTALPGAPGAGVVASAAAANAGVAVTTNAVNPGASTTFTLVVNNTSTIADTYGLTVDPVAPLPTGWAVNFYSAGTPGSCATLGSPLSNTGVVLAGGNIAVCAVVSVPATQVAIPAPGQNIVFKLASPTTGATDFKLDAVTVNTVRSLALTPNNASQVYPGGSVVYKHTLANTGNVTETGVTVSAAMTGATVSWATVLYADTNTNGVLDAADLPLAAVNLTAGQSITVFNKVLAPGAAAAGDVNTTTLTASQPNAALINGVGAPTNTTAQDATTVIVGQVNLTKMQQVDTACAGTVVPASWTNAALTAKPGECILYQITGTNVGTAAVTSLVISDATPASTTYACTGVGVPAGAGSAALVALTGGGAAVPTAPAACAAGNISSGTIATLTPGASVVLTFGVQVNP